MKGVLDIGVQIVEQLLAIWGAVSDWIVSQLAIVQTLFWTAGVDGAAGSFTFLGVISLVAMGIGFVFLLIGVITNFIKFRS